MEQLTSESTTNIVKALLKVQKEVDAVRKDNNNPFFKSKYANIESVLDVVKEPLNKNGIVLLQPVMVENGEAGIATTLLHESGEWLRSFYPLGNKADTPQAQGSQVTYARRYSLISFLSLEQEDDDGNTASVVKTPQKPLQTSTEVSKPTIQDKVEGLRQAMKEDAQDANPLPFGEDKDCPACGSGMVFNPEGKFGPYYNCPNCKKNFSQAKLESGA